MQSLLKAPASSSIEVTKHKEEHLALAALLHLHLCGDLARRYNYGCVSEANASVAWVIGS